MPALLKSETTSTSLISAALIKLGTLFQEGYGRLPIEQKTSFPFCISERMKCV